MTAKCSGSAFKSKTESDQTGCFVSSKVVTNVQIRHTCDAVLLLLSSSELLSSGYDVVVQLVPILLD